MWEWSFCLKCVLILKLFVNFTVCHHKMPNERMSEEVFSDDFENFLKGLGSKVYKFKKTAQVQGTQSRRNEYSYSTPTTRKLALRHEEKPHKDVFEDMLMLKLVSYYENKYKVDGAHTDDDVLLASVMPTFPTYSQHPVTKEIPSPNDLGIHTNKKLIQHHSKQKTTKHAAVDEVLVI